MNSTESKRRERLLLVLSSKDGSKIMRRPTRRVWFGSFDLTGLVWMVCFGWFGLAGLVW